MHEVESLKQAYPSLVVLDGTNTVSVNCMSEYLGETEDIQRFEFVPETRDEYPLVIVWETKQTLLQQS